jgi:hypothetical protein
MNIKGKNEKNRVKAKLRGIKEKMKRTGSVLDNVGKPSRIKKSKRSMKKIKKKVVQPKIEKTHEKQKHNPWDYNMEHSKGRGGEFSSILAKYSKIENPKISKKGLVLQNKTIEDMCSKLLELSKEKTKIVKRNLFSQKVKEANFLFKKDFGLEQLKALNQSFQSVYNIISKKPQFFQIQNDAYLASDKITIRKLRLFLQFVDKSKLSSLTKLDKNFVYFQNFSNIMEKWNTRRLDNEENFDEYQRFLEQENLI